MMRNNLDIHSIFGLAETVREDISLTSDEKQIILNKVSDILNKWGRQ